jgi:hypothetical protein
MEENRKIEDLGEFVTLVRECFIVRKKNGPLNCETRNKIK